MWKVFNITNVGYSHLKTNKVCQDFSDSYIDEQRAIITACDGHGGEIYVRSDRGSRFASQAAMKVLKECDLDMLTEPKLFGGIDCQAVQNKQREIETNIAIKILCEWNEQVDRDLAEDPLDETDCQNLNEERKLRLINQPVKAYGTTLNAVMIQGNKIIYVNLGDGGIFAIGKNDYSEITEDGTADDEDAPVANITYSMCQDDVITNFKVIIDDVIDIESAVACTDGTINPYRNADNFMRSFARPIIGKLKEGKEDEVKEFMINLGTKIGIGDDVSLAVIYDAPTGERVIIDSESTLRSCETVEAITSGSTVSNNLQDECESVNKEGSPESDSTRTNDCRDAEITALDEAQGEDTIPTDICQVGAPSMIRISSKKQGD